jgi:predicted alpha/beta superfamily hydrolase
MNNATNSSLHQIDLDWPETLCLVNNAKRRVWVWLPDDYEHSEDDYSVLFMHDGQNVFKDSDATFGTCWSMIEAQSAIETPMIVVAIEGQNDGMKRFNEFSPWLNAQLSVWKGTNTGAGGQADDYLAFLVSTIVPDIHQRFRCKTNPAHNYLGGSSMGGFISLYAATKYEHVFSNYMAMSTATWFAHNELISCLNTHEFQKTTRVYADIGTQETSNEDMPEFPSIYLNGNKALFEVLSKQLSQGEFQSHIEEGAIHNEAAWAKRLPAALTWLMGNE